MLASTSRHLYARCIIRPLLDYLLTIFSSGIDGIEKGQGGQYASEAEKLCFHSSWFFWGGQSIFWTLPSIALYPAWMYVIKDGEICLVDSDFSARNSLSPEWELISRRKSNLLAILMSKTKPKQNPRNKKTKSLQRPEQLVTYFKNSAPLNPHVDPHPTGSLCYQLEGRMWLCVKHILKTSFPYLNRGYTRKAGGIDTSPLLLAHLDFICAA